MNEWQPIPSSVPRVSISSSEQADTQPGTGVIAGLSNRQDFFEVLRRIERAQQDAPRLGSTNDNSRERLHIIQPADVAFASREVVDIEQHLSQVHITARHFGLFAPYGPLPIHITEHARTEMLAKRNRAFQQFVGILSQRFAVLHYRAWSQLQSMVGHDHTDDKNPFLQHLRQSIGVDPHQTMSSHIQRLREAYPGVYLPGRRSLQQLKNILATYFSVPIDITPRYAKWIDDGKKADSQKMGYLGKMRIGRRFFDAQYGAHIEIGPLAAPDYELYQRGSQRLQALASICHDFMSRQLILDISLLIKTEPGMAARLGNQSLSKDGWLKPAVGTYRQRVYQSTT